MTEEKKKKEMLNKIREIEAQMKELAIDLYELSREFDDEEFEDVVGDVVSRLEVIPNEKDSLREAINFLEFNINRPCPFN